MERRVRIRWTRPARDKLATLPLKARRAILAKTGALAKTDPKTAHKPLTGPLQGYYSLRVGRYRALYRVEEEQLANGDTFVSITVLVVVVGQRKEGDKRDVYKLAEKLIRYANREIDRHEGDAET